MDKNQSFNSQLASQKLFTVLYMSECSLNVLLGQNMWYSALPLLLSVGTAVLVPQHLLDYTRAQEADKTTGYMYGHQGTEEKSFCSWQCLLFTLQWPGAFCQVILLLSSSSLLTLYVNKSITRNAYL